MYHNTHATVGQSQGSRVLSAPQRAGSSATPGLGVRPRSPFPLRPSALRLGLSLTEVLISMGILTVGLLGVASVFPVASFYMQKGDIADRGSAIAQAAFNDAFARGDLDPAKWWAMTPPDDEPLNYRVASPPAMNSPGPDGFPQSFSRPLAEAVLAAKTIWSNSAACQKLGGVFVIDPIGAAALSDYATLSNPAARNQKVARSFPSSVAVAPIGDFYGQQWDQWVTNSSPLWPIRRVTFRQPIRSPFQTTAEKYRESSPMNRVTADRLYSSGDDLAMEMPVQQDRPSITRFDTTVTGGVTNAMARQSRGDYSWLITVAPISTGTLFETPMEVSTVVFHKRRLESVPTDEDSMKVSAAGERMAKGSIVSTGLSGGEVLLTPVADGLPETPFNVLKKGEWVMLCGPAPSSAAENPQFVARWYRVLSIEDEGTGKLVSLRGPQWPWEPQTGSNALSNNLCVGIFPGAVAVHAKTVQLEGKSAWGVQ